MAKASTCSPQIVWFLLLVTTACGGGGSPDGGEHGRDGDVALGNRAPVLGVGDGAVLTGTGQQLLLVVGDSFRVTIEATDADGDELTVSASIAVGSLAPSSFGLSEDFPIERRGAAPQTLILEGVAGEAGRLELVCYATDGVGSDTLRFTVDVSEARPVPARIQMFSGMGQAAVVATALAEPVAVKVFDQYGAPIAGAMITFQVVAGGGSADGGGEVYTGLTGVAATHWMLGESSGLNELHALSSGLEGGPVVFTAMGTHALAAAISVVSGDAQIGIVGEKLAEPLVVRVSDHWDNAVEGEEILWFAGQGEGHILADTPLLSDVSGRVIVDVVQGSLPGPVFYSATLARQPLVTTTFTTMARPGAPASIAYLSGDAQIARPGESLPMPLIARVSDIFGNQVQGADVEFAAVVGEGMLVPANPVVSNAQGEAAVAFTAGTTAAIVEIEGTVGGVAGRALFSVIVADVGVPFKLKLVSGDVQTAVVDTVLADPVVVKVSDAFDNPVEGVLVSFTTLGSSGSFDSPATITTNVAGEAAANWRMPVIPGEHGASAAVEGLRGSPVSFTATGVPDVPATLVLLSGDAQTGVIGSVLDEPLVVVVADRHGNPVREVVVTFAVVSGGGEFAGGNTVLTDVGGVAANIFTVGALVGTQLASASVAALPGIDLIFSLTGVGLGPELRIVSGAGQSAMIQSTLPQPIVVEMLDGLAIPMEGIEVTFGRSDGGDKLDPAFPVLTDASGLASVLLTLGTHAGLRDVEATVLGARNSPARVSATALPGAAAALSMVSGDEQVCIVEQPLPKPLVAMVTDAYGNPVEGIGVFFAVQGGDGVLSVPDLVATNASGRASTTYSLGASLATNVVQASVIGLAGSPIVYTAHPHPAADRIELVSGDAQNAAAGTALMSPLVVRVLDSSGAGVPGFEVRFTLSGSGVIEPAGLQFTDPSGEAAVTLSLGAAAGTSLVQVEGPCLKGSPVLMTAYATAGAADRLSYISGNNQVGAAGRPLGTPIAVRVADRNGNPVAGHAVTFLPVSGGSMVEQQPVITSQTGHAYSNFVLGTALGSYGVSVNAGAIAGSPLAISATAYQPPFSIAIVSGDGQAAEVVMPLSEPLIVQVHDGLGAPLPGYSVGFLATVGAGALQAAAVVSDINGMAANEYTLGSIAGPNLINAFLQEPASVVFEATALAGPVRKLQIKSGNAQFGTVGAPLNEPFVVQLVDALGNGVAGLPVNYVGLIGDGTIVESLPVITDVGGLARATYAVGGLVGTHLIEASAAVPSGSPAVFSVEALGEPALLEIVSGDNQQKRVAMAFDDWLSVRVTDDFGNPVPGVEVDWEVVSGLASIRSKVPTLTNVAGRASASVVCGVNAGPLEVSATSVDLQGASAVFHLTVLPASAYRLWYISGDTQNGIVGQTLSQAMTVRIEDPFGNGVPNAEVQFQTMRGGGTTDSEQPVLTDAQGYAATMLVLGSIAGPNEVQAAASGLNGSPLYFSADAAPDVPASLLVHSGNSQFGTVVSPLEEPIVVAVQDRFMNGVPGLPVEFVIDAGGGSFEQSGPLFTDADGRVSNGWILGATRGDNLARATAIAVPDATLIATAQLPPASIEAIGGDLQVGQANRLLVQPLAAVVRDSFNNVLRGIPVTFVPHPANGTVLEAQPMVTAADGTVSVNWKLGALAGPHVLDATAKELATVLEFNADATGVPGVATYIEMLSGDSQKGRPGQTVDMPLAVFIGDAFGTPVSAVDVEFVSGGGGAQILSSQPTTTDSLGMASTLVSIGNRRGIQRVEARAPGLVGSDVSFSLRVPIFDFDGDGIDDFAVSTQAPSATESVLVFLGGDTVTANATTDTVTTILTGESDNARFGLTLASAGDVNADGIDDLIVAASSAARQGQDGLGAAYIFLGRQSVPPSLAAATDSVIVSGTSTHFGIGTAVAGCGDFNGDNIDDFIVTSKALERAYLYFGSNTLAAGTLLEPGDADVTMSIGSGKFGLSVAGIGDFNGDGFGDVAVGAPFDSTVAARSGAVMVFFGVGGIASGTILQRADVGVTFLGNSKLDYFGHAVAAAADLNNDGLADLLVSAPYDDEEAVDAGAIYVWFGNPSWSAGGSFLARDADVLVSGATRYERFGTALASGPDIDGDGVSDVVVGVPLADQGGTDAGASYVLLGSAMRPGSHSVLAIGHVFLGASPADFLGTSVSLPGDVNDDGFADVLVGAPGVDNGATSNTGALHLFLGKPVGWSIGSSMDSAHTLIGAPSVRGLGTAIVR